jgi:hypothetical protein
VSLDVLNVRRGAFSGQAQLDASSASVCSTVTLFGVMFGEGVLSTVSQSQEGNILRCFITRFESCVSAGYNDIDQLACSLLLEFHSNINVSEQKKQSMVTAQGSGLWMGSTCISHL